MDDPKVVNEILADVDGGRVLDVAAGRGGSVKALADSLGTWDSILGVDVSDESLAEARENVGSDRIRFARMDARCLALPDAAFDTVGLSNSLHHLPDVPAALAEIRRVLRPGGWCVVSEMYRDGQSEPQLTHDYLHHWWASVDRALGQSHNETFRRQQIIDIVADLDLRLIAVLDVAGLDRDPLDPETIEHLDGVIDRTCERAEGLPDYESILARGQDLRRRLHAVGALGPSRLVVIGRKPEPPAGPPYVLFGREA